MTKTTCLRAFLHQERSQLRPRSLQALVCTVAICISTTLPSVVNADPPISPPSASSSEPGSPSSPPNSVSASADPNRTNASASHSDSHSGDTAQKSKPVAARSRAFDRNAVLDRSLSRGKYLVNTALGYRGLPYRWGGTSPRSGFDCSGLVQTVYAKWGIYLPRCAHEQVSKGIHIPKDQLQAGDLVFFKNTYKHGLSHVGIYVGEGWFVHAASRRSGVILSRLDSPYNLHHWYGARRLNLSKLPPVPNEEPQEPPKVILEDTADGADAPPQTPAPSAPESH